MPVLAILGGQWGDEGKGKIVDVLCETADVVVRFQGGANAGHTIQIQDQETILHQIPSGVLRQGVHCILGNGMVIDPIGLREEIELVKRRGIQTEGRLHISRLAHVVTPLHKALDSSIEHERGKAAIGTTKRGIGPCYTDKVSRRGIRMKELEAPDLLRDKIQEQLARAFAQERLPECDRAELEKQMGNFFESAQALVPYLDNTVSLINHYEREGRQILVEGAQGSLLDLDFGSYPYVTSSNTIAGNISTGTGLAPNRIRNIIGVFKAYSTRVGHGPFPTELYGGEGDYLQQKGDEFGATTRRRRRCGWFDAALAKFSVMVNGFSSVAITKLDVLQDLSEIRICTHYENGEYPDIDLEQARPRYQTLPGWQTDITHIQHYQDLPREARDYLDCISDLLATPISHISVGKKRNQIIERNA